MCSDLDDEEMPRTLEANSPKEEHKMLWAICMDGEEVGSTSSSSSSNLGAESRQVLFSGMVSRGEEWHL
jgi:aspartyl aminopeptidase